MTILQLVLTTKLYLNGLSCKYLLLLLSSKNLIFNGLGSALIWSFTAIVKNMNEK